MGAFITCLNLESVGGDLGTWKWIDTYSDGITLGDICLQLGRDPSLCDLTKDFKDSYGLDCYNCDMNSKVWWSCFWDPTLPTIVFSFSPEGTRIDGSYLLLVTVHPGQAIAYNHKMRNSFPSFRISAFRQRGLPAVVPEGLKEPQSNKPVDLTF